jgi:transposase
LLVRIKYEFQARLRAICGLVREHSISVAQAARDLDIHDNVLRRWVRQYREDPVNAFPGAGQMKPEQAEIVRLKKEIQGEGPMYWLKNRDFQVELGLLRRYREYEFTQIQLNLILRVIRSQFRPSFESRNCSELSMNLF